MQFATYLVHMIFKNLEIFLINLCFPNQAAQSNANKDGVDGDKDDCQLQFIMLMRKMVTHGETRVGGEGSCPPLLAPLAPLLSGC